MKIVKGKITEATEEELMEYYLRTDSDEIFPFKEYLERMIDAGVKIIEENENNMKGL